MILKKKINSEYIYLISDIHANLDLFKKAIIDLDLNKDILFILGDIFEKGNENIATIDYVIDLMNKYPNNVYSIAGNCDKVINELKSPCDINKLKKYSQVLKKTILNEFLEGIGVDIYSKFDMNEKLDLINIKYKKYFEFVNGLPLGYFINNSLLLTHADIYESGKKNLIDKETFKNYKYDLNIVGHLPNMMYKAIANMDPLLKDNVLYIDAGNHVVEFGGLNLVKLSLKDYSYSFKTFYDYPIYKVIHNQESNGDKYIPYKARIDKQLLIDDIYKVIINNEEYYVTKNNIIDNEYAYDALNMFASLEKDELVYVPYFGKSISIIIKNNTAYLAYSKNISKDKTKYL